MKRSLSLALAVLVLAAASPLAFANEETEVYRQIYLDAVGLQQKYAAALNLVGLQDRSVAPILSEALTELVREQQSYSGAVDRELYGTTLRLLCSALGDYKYDDAAPSLWDVVSQAADPLARAEALIALGKIRATDYAERIALILRNLDIAPGPDKLADEQVAYGAILSLEKLRDPRGFMPVFYATDAWYTLRVRQQAERSLPNIVADPTDAVIELLRTEPPARQLFALKLSAASKAAPDRRIKAALVGLQVTQTAATQDKATALALSDVRKYAIRSLIALRATGAEEVPLAVQSYTNGYDDEERLLALQALGVNAGDEAATALRDIILKLDREQKSGITDETRNRMAKAAIENAGIAKNRAVRAALLAVIANDKWSGGVILAAQTALKAIP
jgi:hypothetical protein